MSGVSSSLRSRFDRVVDQISEAASSAGRSSNEIRLIVVTKGHSLDVIREVIQAGAQNIGENYPVEGSAKVQALADESDVQWHMIGHVQSRKARLVVENFNYMHALDSLKLARRLDRFAGETGRKLPVLLECNVSGEASKHGWPAEDEAVWEILLEDVADIVKLKHLKIHGLMTMAPYSAKPENARPFFARLTRLSAYLAGQFPEVDWNELSMGMSSDFIPAIQEGATMVRIGSAITGPRPVKNIDAKRG